MELGVGFVPVRKLGKLPYETIQAEYALEYGTNVVENSQRRAASGNESRLSLTTFLQQGALQKLPFSLLRNWEPGQGFELFNRIRVFERPEVIGRI